MTRLRARGWARVAGAAFALACGAAPAAEYFADPAVTLGAQYDSNTRQDRTDERDAYGAELDAALRLVARSPVSVILLSPRVQVYRYDDDALERTDESVDAILERSLSKNFKARVEGHYANVSLLNDPLDDGTRASATDRDSWSAAPILTWQVAEHDALEAEFSYNETMYEDEADGRADYDFRIATLRWIRQWTPATKGSVEAYGSSFRNLDDGSQSETIGGRLGVETALSPTLTLNSALGYARSEFECDAVLDVNLRLDCVRDGFTGLRVEETNNNVLGKLSLEKRFSATSSVRVGYERSAGASGRGSRTVRDVYSLLLAQDLSERLGLRFEGQLRRNNPDADANRAGGGNADSDLGRALLEMRYRLAEHWSTGIGYRYRYRQDDDEPGSAETHNPFVFVSYGGTPRTVVR